MQTNKLLMYGVFGLLALVALGVVQIPSTTPGAIIPRPGEPVPPATCNLATTSTITSTAYDAAKTGTTVGSETKAYYLDTTTGQLNPGGSTVQPGQTITVLSTKSSWFGTKNTQAIPCAPSILMSAKMKAVDTALDLTAYNTDGTTKNYREATTGTNLSIGSGGSGTVHLKIVQSAAYKFLSGEDGRFAVFVNATNVTDFAPAQMSAVFDNVACVNYGQAGLSNTATPSGLGGTLIAAFICLGDFQPNDGAVHDLAVKVAASSAVDPGLEDIGLALAGIDLYADTIDNHIGIGAVKDSGGAIQTLQVQAVGLS